MDPIGELRQRITIQSADAAQNSSGEMIPSWTDYVTLWARVSPMTGRELLAAEQILATVSHTIQVRWPGRNFAITAGQRAKFTDPLGTVHYFDIQAVVNDDQRNRILQLLCTERVGQD